jgi:hypothetical protein
MRQLFQTRRLCCNLTGIRSSSEKGGREGAGAISQF